MKIAIYTSITASKDSLKEPKYHAGADCILFSDQTESLNLPESWDVRSACDLFIDPRRNSRSPKLLAHQYFHDYDYSLWIDGSIRLLVPVHDLIDEYLGQMDIALFRHPIRDCIYEEAAACTEQGLDDPDIMAAQMVKYRREGYPARNGLNESGVILRRHNARIESFNNAWWSEYCRHSCRDQLSLNYSLYKFGICPALFPGVIGDNPGIVSYEWHLK